jgi:hypothetical protein
MTRPAAATQCRRCKVAIKPFTSGGRGRAKASARGICGLCYFHIQGTDELLDYERVTRSRDDLLDDYELLRSDGLTWREIAARLHMPYATFERAMLRARKEGDPRARRIGELHYPHASKGAA